MKSFASLAKKAVKRFLYKAAFAFVIIFTLSLAGFAQQPAAGRKKVPRLTTEDVARPQPEPSAEEAGKEKTAGKEEAGKGPATAKANDKASADEVAWRERVAQARERAKSLERAADESELSITELRNTLARSGQTANDRNQTAVELERAGQQLLDLRAQARAASIDLDQLLEYGKQKDFSEAKEPGPSGEDGRPNEEYYRSRYAKLLEEAQTAERREQLYENRLSDLSQRITNNSGSGDNFYISQLRQERQEAQEKLDEARAARVKAQNDLEALQEEARRAGVPPGVFR